MAEQRHFIRQWRKHRGLTQVQLAERIGLDQSYITKIENGRRRYDQVFLEAAAEVLNCSPADLIMRDPTKADPIWSIWEQVPETQRQQALEVLKTFKKVG